MAGPPTTSLSLNLSPPSSNPMRRFANWARASPPASSARNRTSPKRVFRMVKPHRTLAVLKMKRLVTLIFAVCTGACLHAPPPHPRALEANELCAQYIGVNDLTRAEVQCDLGLQFAPQYADLWVNKGLIALKRGQEDNAKD